MKLPSIFKKQTPKEYFLALLLQDEFLRAVVFEENNGTIHVLGQGQQPLPAPIDDTAFEELLTASDKAISSAENSLPNNTQSHKTIFGVKGGWTEDLQIGKDHLATLKRLCDELDLQPIGFLVFAEAIAHLLQKEEGAPVSAILVELGTKHISATLLRAGRIIADKQIAIEENLPKTVDTLLTQFTDVEILPSRIILLDDQKRPQITQQFINHSWSKQLPFLHVPQITPLADEFETQAILFGTATQMGFDMLGLPEMKMTKGEAETNELEKPKSIENEEIATPIQEITQSDEDMGQDENPQQSEPTQNSQDSEEKLDQEEQPEEKIPQTSGDDFGFVKDQDVLASSPKNPVAFDNLRKPDDESSEEFANETFANIPEDVKEKGERSKLPGLGANAVMITEGMENIFAQVRKVPFISVFSPLKKIPLLLQGASGSSRKWMLLFPAALILIFAAIFWYMLGIKATATLIIDPKIVEKSQGVTFSSTNSTDIGSDTIGGSSNPITENGSTSTQATGSQDVGDKAKGTVTIYNNDDTSHTVNAGSTITSANGLKFVTSKDITIASASGDIFSGTKPGTQNVDVTASDIGTDYNLPSGTKFALGSSSVLAAKNDTAFSGGTKKTVTVVSQKDLDKLTSDLKSNLGNKAKQDVQNNSTSGKIVLPTFLSTDMSNQKFDHKVGDQTSSVNLTATITYQTISYSKDDLNKVVVAIMQSNNPGENISSQNVSEDIQNPTVSTDGKDINATLKIKAGLLPKIDTSKVAKTLAGKPFSQALNALSDIQQLSAVQGVLSPNLFFLPKSYPSISSHITVGVKANE